MKSYFSDINKLSDHQNNATSYTYTNYEGDFIDGIRRGNDKMMPSFVGPEGGIYSTTRDLYTYFKAINNHTIVDKQTKELLHEKHAEIYPGKDESYHYGYGFSMSQQGGLSTIGHSGVFLGVGIRFEYYPKQDYSVIVLSNYGSIAGSVVADHIKDLIEPK
ncbi:MAG: CubicO group peptidase (beta-lactamase class C family) [Saprospiraceae bacterium]|jgi:CubicO group peptidase (beta-lactamase class C family)